MEGVHAGKGLAPSFRHSESGSLVGLRLGYVYSLKLSVLLESETGLSILYYDMKES